MNEPEVLFVATDLSTGGGVNKVIRDLAVLFRQRFGVSVAVVNARSDRPPSYTFPPDVGIEQNRHQSLPRYFAFLWRLRKRRPHIAISSWTQDNVLITLAFLFSRTKVVLVEHAPWHFHGRAIRLLRRIAYPFASQIVVLNRRDFEHYRRYLSNVRLIPNPVTAPSIGSNVSREKLILAIGHLEPLKNFEDAIRAMAKSGLEDSGWSLAIVGSGSSEPNLQRLIDQAGLKRTKIHPPTLDLGSWYARASILLLTSRLESFSLVLAEAMLSGVIPLAYASDGPCFILEEFPTHLVGVGDVDALAQQLRHIAECASLSPLREKIRASIHVRFSPDVVAEQWRRLLLTK